MDSAKSLQRVCKESAYVFHECIAMSQRALGDEASGKKLGRLTSMAARVRDLIRLGHG